ncbi:MAG: glycosyltransferase family 2 protein [Bacteroidales bacterium]|nr:glycosyltransferase family 2 protein [Bacteroidales bacterium]MDD2322857.1 glycosyltransferase family 2 protein [Bacteroidales bacterium]HPE86247.1 glycosyltransferase family 2 protein [Bacteroidales bacterium]
MKKPDFSVVIPVFNSEKALQELTAQLFAVFTILGHSWELIFVDDCSHDSSWEVIQSLQKAHPQHISGYHLARNFGQHNATLCGLKQASGHEIITMDDDLQHSPSDIPTLIATKHRENAELIYGVFPQRKQRLLRRTLSTLLQISGQRMNDGPGNGSSFRLISQRVAKKITRFQWQFVYLDDMLYWHTQAIGFAEVTHHASAYRKSGYSHRSLAKILYNLFVFNTTLPLKLMTFSGLIISILAAAGGIWFIVRKLLYDVPMGFTSLIVAILFSTALITFGLGIIGEYLRRLYLNQTGNPAYSIDRKAPRNTKSTADAN